MNRIARIALLLAIAAGCQHAPTREPTKTEYRLGEGGTVTVKRDGEIVGSLAVRGGELFLNGRNLGPYRTGAPIRILGDGTLTVDGVRRETGRN